MAYLIPAPFLKALMLQAALYLALAQDNHCPSEIPVSEVAQQQVLLQRSTRSIAVPGSSSNVQAGKVFVAEEDTEEDHGSRAAPGSSSQEQTGKVFVAEEAEEGTKEETGGGREGPGFTGDLDEETYQVVAATCCNYQMEEFIRRVTDDLGLEICSEGGFTRLVSSFSCDSYTPPISAPAALTSFERRTSGMNIQDFTTLRQSIVDSATSQCPIAAGPRSCPPDSSTCAGVPDPAYHRRRNCRSGRSTTFTTTTTSGPTTTTTTTTETTQTTTTTITTTHTTTTRTTSTTETTLKTTITTSTTTSMPVPVTTMLATTTTTTTSTGCKGETDVLDMFETELVQSNLGGAGPDFGFEGMRFESAGTHEGRPFDMVVTATGSYKPQKSTDNGYECGQPVMGCTTGHFAQISVTAGTRANLTIEFQDSATQSPVTLSSFIFSLHDIDRLDKSVEEVIYISGFTDAVILDKATEVVSTLESDGRTKLTAGRDGTDCDDPQHPDRLSSVTCSGVAIDQKKRSAAFLFQETSSIVLSLEVTCHNCTANSGRGFLFAGETNLVSCAGKRYARAAIA